jgi:hypothetical protein
MTALWVACPAVEVERDTVDVSTEIKIFSLRSLSSGDRKSFQAFPNGTPRIPRSRFAPFLIVGYTIALPYDQKRGRTRLFSDHDVMGRSPRHSGCARHRGLCPVDAGPSPGFRRRGRGHRLLGCTSFMRRCLSLLPRLAMEMFLFGVAYLVVLFDHKEYITRT